MLRIITKMYATKKIPSYSYGEGEEQRRFREYNSLFPNGVPHSPFTFDMNSDDIENLGIFDRRYDSVYALMAATGVEITCELPPEFRLLPGIYTDSNQFGDAWGEISPVFATVRSSRNVYIQTFNITGTVPQDIRNLFDAIRTGTIRPNQIWGGIQLSADQTKLAERVASLEQELADLRKRLQKE